MFWTAAIVLAMVLPQAAAGTATKIKSGVSDDVRESALGGMWYEAFAAPDGTIEACRVRVAVGDTAAAAEVCDHIVGLRVTPAKDPEGHRTYGYFLGALSFADNLTQMPVNALPADMTIAAKGLPDGKGARVGVTVEVGSDGKVLACQPANEASALGKVACQQVGGTELPVGKSKAGAAVAYLRPMIVDFEPDPG
jgi:hypothetical protein